MEETPVCAASDLIDDVGLEVNVERARHVLARRGLREESAEAIVVSRGRALNETTIGLKTDLDHIIVRKRVDTHAKTVLDGVELPCDRTTIRTFLTTTDGTPSSEGESPTRRSAF